MEQMRELQNMDTSATAEKNSAVQTGKPAYANGNKVPNVPPLRFPEFTEEWKEFCLEDLCTFLSGGTPSIDNMEYWNGEIPFVSAVAMHDTIIKRTPLSLTKKGLLNGSKLLKANNILLLVRGSMLWNKIPVCYNSFDVAFNQDVKGIVPSKNITSLFLLNWILSHENRIKHMVTGTGIGAGKLDSTELFALKVKIPSLHEQNKIESFLSLIDDRIATQNKIIDKLQSLMSGIVVSHFNSCNTKSTISIKDLGEAYSVGNLSKDDLSEEGKPCILYGELFTTYGCVACEVQNRTNKYAQATLSRAGDLLFPASTTVDAISLIAPTSLQTDGVYVAGDMFGIHISPQYKSEYISYLLNYVYNRKLSKYAQGSTIIHLHYADVKNATIQVPCLEEQNKCAGLLEALQTKLDIAKQLIDCYQIQKSYLLQRMFI